jgi:hypothetical protein
VNLTVFVWLVDAFLWTVLDLIDPRVEERVPYRSTIGEWRT